MLCPTDNELAMDEKRIIENQRQLSTFEERNKLCAEFY
jgi:hypothetical protein